MCRNQNFGVVGCPFVFKTTSCTTLPAVFRPEVVVLMDKLTINYCLDDEVVPVIPEIKLNNEDRN